MKPIRFALIATVALCMVAMFASAASVVKVGVDPGTTQIVVGGVEVRVETTARVVVYLTVSGDSVTGMVEPARGTSSSQVAISVLGPPDRVVFFGRVKSPTYFSEYIPQETGRGEQ